MAWPELSIEDFPPERDDEPSSLRQDIIDELSDHFACALNRELLKNPDEQIAKQRVIQNFGDPIKIARQLWLDAMKEKIMSQRIMTGVSVVMAVCCIAVVGFAWILVQESRVVNQKMLEHVAVLADRPVASAESGTDQEILLELKRLNQLQATGVVAGQDELQQVSFQLVTDQNSQPATGFKGRLLQLVKGLDGFTVDVVSDTQGKLDFGKLPAGAYALELKAPWGEMYQIQHLRTIPGRAFSKTIVCPAHQPELVSIGFQVDCSAEFESDKWLFLVDFGVRQVIHKKEKIERYYSSERQIENETWLYAQPVNQGVYLIGKNGAFSPIPMTQTGKYPNLKPDFPLDQLRVKVPQGRYALPVVYLINRDDLSQLAIMNENYFDPVSSEMSHLVSGLSRYIPDGTMYGIKQTIFVSPLNILDKQPIEVSTGEILQYPVQHFVATPGKNNIWTINLYDKKIARVN
ncbi:hypothetical protein Mal35_43130 [Gimesia maris]|uniref:hypothetical protein n=1 Tax=Gimesia maris TaxID=122 RepID=UPI0011893372|nr:hypothetical protein [Gimesia maris]QDT80838.1 hypothetical protein Mal35_43130 [Gimesia maris]